MQLCRATQFRIPLHFLKKCDTIAACQLDYVSTFTMQCLDGKVPDTVKPFAIPLGFSHSANAHASADCIISL